jgi:CheY-like chemotaxis protein
MASERPSSTTGLRVLVVDDDRDGVDTLALLVKLLGHEAQTCFSGPEASADYHSFRPHVIFLDLGLPGLDGFQVAQQIRQEISLSQPVIVAYTGYADPSHREKAAGLFDHYLVKPSDPADLERILVSVAKSFTVTAGSSRTGPEVRPVVNE